MHAADERRVPVEKVRAEGRQGQPVPESLLPVHRRAGLPGAQAGNRKDALQSLPLNLVAPAGCLAGIYACACISHPSVHGVSGR